MSIREDVPLVLPHSAFPDRESRLERRVESAYCGRGNQWGVHAATWPWLWQSAKVDRRSDFHIKPCQQRMDKIEKRESTSTGKPYRKNRWQGRVLRRGEERWDGGEMKVENSLSGKWEMLRSKKDVKKTAEGNRILKGIGEGRDEIQDTGSGKCTDPISFGLVLKHFPQLIKEVKGCEVTGIAA